MMQLNLDEESEQIIRRQVESGAFPSPSEVVNEALRLLEGPGESEAEIEELRREIALGIEQADRGELIAGSQVFAAIGRRLMPNGQDS